MTDVGQTSLVAYYF